jgi:hypothetical protein
VIRPISLLLLACAASAGAEPRSGKVVRIERRLQKSGPIRLCEIKANGGGQCFGDRPADGDVIAVLDEQQVFAEVKITHIEPPQDARCDAMWAITGDVLRGDLSGSQWGRSIGVIDTRLDRRNARKLPEDRLPTAPSGRPEEKVIGAIDRTGSGSPDIDLTAFQCDSNGQASAQGNEQCFEIWSHDQPGGWHRVRQMLLSPCFR